MKKLAFIGILFSFGCATVHPSLDSVRDQFVAEGRSRNVVVRPEAVKLVFVDELPGMAGGRCFPNQSPRLVEISRKFWDDNFYTDTTRRQIVYHELGHCLLGIRNHVPNLAVNVVGKPEVHVSMMEREAIPYNYYYGYEAEWLDRLFGRDLTWAYSSGNN